MEEKRAKSFRVVFIIVLCLVVGQSYAASFSDCYKGCFLICVITPGGSIFNCATKCVKDCIFPSSLTSLDDKQQTLYFCKFGCASSLCTNLSSKTDPGEKKVASCVNSCSNRCIKNYSP